jgi:hypothetical protein
MGEAHVPTPFHDRRRETSYKVHARRAVFQGQIRGVVPEVHVSDHTVDRPAFELGFLLPPLLTERVEEGEKGLAFLPKIYGLLQHVLISDSADLPLYIRW